MINKPAATGLAILFFLFVGLYLGYQQGETDGREANQKIRLRPTANLEDLLGTQAELIEILTGNDPLERGQRLAEKLQQLGPESLQEVLDAYDAIFFELGDFEFEMLATWWARFDPQAAFDFTRTYWEANNYSVPQAVLRQWASMDPQAAMEAAILSGNTEVPDPFLFSVITGWDESGHPGLYEFVYKLGPGAPRQRALMHLAQRQIRRNGIEATIAWAEGLPSEGTYNAALKLNAFRRVAAAAVMVDPEAATEFARKHFHSPYGVSVPSWVGRRWSFSEPEATMEWLSTLPEGTNRDKGVADAYLAWLRRDHDAAMDWASQQDPDADWFQPALSTYARQLSLSDRPRALELAAYVDHPDYRLITIGRILRTWLREDPLAARSWMKNSTLTIEERARVLNQTVAPNSSEASVQLESP
ncbi:MAG: hypothetical protein CMN75_17165 [Spirochaeta sp.]|nr:hypothetical protein [Spirochaeta sp.]RPG12048.1 MAG: hypothetical protein CBC32_004495 [Proteobacteria bacterium TMED72]